MRGAWKPFAAFQGIALGLMAALFVLRGVPEAGTLGLSLVFMTGAMALFAGLFLAITSWLLHRFRRGLDDAGLSYTVVDDEVGWMGQRTLTVQSDHGTWTVRAEANRTSTGVYVQPPWADGSERLIWGIKPRARELARRTITSGRGETREATGASKRADVVARALTAHPWLTATVPLVLGGLLHIASARTLVAGSSPVPLWLSEAGL